MPKIKGVHDETYEIDSVGKTYTFTKTYLGHDPTFEAIREDGSNNTIILHGTAESNAGRAAIRSEGDGVTIRIAPDGIVRGSGYPIACYGADALVINEGKIFGTVRYGGVYLSSYAIDAEFINKGKIFGEQYAVGFNGDRSQVVNSKGALISGSYAVVVMGGDEGVDLKFINHGKVKSDTTAVLGYHSNDMVINDGKIIGSISLEDGEDKIDTRGGKVTGMIFGGAGDDTLITDKTGYKLAEAANEGFDTVKSTVTYRLSSNVEKLVLLGTKNIDGKGTASNDTLIGNSGNNILWGHEGDDRLDGMAGNDVLRGGAGADTFVFKTGYDKDTIVLFNDGLDKVDVSGWKAIKNFSDLISNHASNHGDDVWIVAGKDRLIIENAQKADLDAGDFVF